MTLLSSASPKRSGQLASASPRASSCSRLVVFFYYGFSMSCLAELPMKQQLDANTYPMHAMSFAFVDFKPTCAGHSLVLLTDVQALELPLGESVTLAVGNIACNSRAQAAVVDVPAHLSLAARPHITISVAAGAG